MVHSFIQQLFGDFLCATHHQSKKDIYISEQNQTLTLRVYTQVKEDRQIYNMIVLYMICSGECYQEKYTTEVPRKIKNGTAL